MKIGDLVKFSSNRVIGVRESIGIIVAIGTVPPSAIVHWSDDNTKSYITIEALEVLSSYESR